MARAVGNSTPHDMVKKKKKQKLAFTAVETDGLGCLDRRRYKKNRLGQIWVRTRLDPISSATFRRWRYTVKNKTKVTKGERDLKASEK